MAVAWGRYGIGEPKVEKLTVRFAGSPSQRARPSTVGAGSLPGWRPSSSRLCTNTIPLDACTPRITSTGTQAPLNSEPLTCSGTSRPVEIWYAR